MSRPTPRAKPQAMRAPKVDATRAVERAANAAVARAVARNPPTRRGSTAPRLAPGRATWSAASSVPAKGLHPYGASLLAPEQAALSGVPDLTTPMTHKFTTILNIPLNVDTEGNFSVVVAPDIHANAWVPQATATGFRVCLCGIRAEEEKLTTYSIHDGSILSDFGGTMTAYRATNQVCNLYESASNDTDLDLVSAEAMIVPYPDDSLLRRSVPCFQDDEVRLKLVFKADDIDETFTGSPFRLAVGFDLAGGGTATITADATPVSSTAPTAGAVMLSTALVVAPAGVLGIRSVYWFPLQMTNSTGMEILSGELDLVVITPLVNGPWLSRHLRPVPVEDVETFESDFKSIRFVGLSALMTYRGKMLEGGYIAGMAVSRLECPATTRNSILGYQNTSRVPGAYDGPIGNGAYSFYLPTDPVDYRFERPTFNPDFFRHGYLTFSGKLTDPVDGSVRLRVAAQMEAITYVQRYGKTVTPSDPAAMGDVHVLSQLPRVMENSLHLATIARWLGTQARDLATKALPAMGAAAAAALLGPEAAGAGGLAGALAARALR